jgi:superfamily II DNA or RNA helicase
LPSLIDSKIANCKSWADFEQLVAAHENKDKGDLFERLTQLFLQTSPTYKSKIRNVWWCNNPYTNEFPEAVRQKLNLPEKDEGIDLICETFEGKYWSVQAKYRTDNDRALTTKELSKFLNLSFVTSGQIELGLITHTSTKPVRKQDLMGHTTELGLQNFLEMSPEQWKQIAGICANNAPLPPIARTPEPFQRAAIENAIKHFQTENNARGKLIMPCGTGKSLMAYWMAREMNAKSIILAVPSLALVKQSLGDWTAEFLAEGIRPEWLAVCSDDSVGSMKEADSTVSTVYEAGIPATTDQFEIIKFLEKRTDDPKVIFTTYQSSEVLAEACTTAGFTADLLIADEAHKTVGSSAKKFATLVSDDNILINKRLFMTATERVIRGSGEGEVVSMDDVSVYGEVFHQMSFAEAIHEKIICDYKILTLFVSENETSDLVSQRQTVEVQQGNRKIETDAHSLAVGLAVEKAFKKYGVKRAITFHSSIKRAENFANQQREFSGLVSEGLEIDYQTISSKQTAGQRSKRLHDFKSKDLALLSNARCLTEGVDIPSIDCVAFVDPKQSVVDIVQAAGRAMRKSDETGKDHGYILIPISVPPDYSLEEFGDLTDFKSMTRIITSLSTQDERIAEELKAGIHGSGGGQIIIDDDFVKDIKLDYDDFCDQIRTQIWSTVGRANWRPFEEAREFVRALGLDGQKDWHAWSASSERPSDIPSDPQRVYKYKGWKNTPDWVGSSFVATKDRTYLSFEDARKFVIGLNFETYNEWKNFAKSELKPENIPGDPRWVYRDSGWAGGLHWIGREETNFMSYAEAKEYVSNLPINTQSELQAWEKANGRTNGFPSNPDNYYRGKGWVDWPSFFEREKLTPSSEMREFNEAKKYVQSLAFANISEYVEWAKSAKRPADIPVSPRVVYGKEKDWNGMAEFIGSKNIAPSLRTFLPLKDAMLVVKQNNIASRSQYNSWSKTDSFPQDLPKDPAKTYQKAGWSGWPAFTGSNNHPPGSKVWRSFEEAKAWVASAGIKTKKQFTEKSNSADFPNDIPKTPDSVYADSGWSGYPDFLGSGPRDFKSARAFVRNLNLESLNEWREWCKSPARPSDIPTQPRRTYANLGWVDWYDWLGKPRQWQREEDPET